MVIGPQARSWRYTLLQSGTYIHTYMVLTGMRLDLENDRGSPMLETSRAPLLRIAQGRLLLRMYVHTYIHNIPVHTYTYIGLHLESLAIALQMKQCQSGSEPRPVHGKQLI